MPGAYPTRADDIKHLAVLDAIHGSKQAYEDAGRKHGMSKGAVAGLVKRIRDTEVPCKCRKKANRDGGMKRRWWRGEA